MSGFALPSSLSARQHFAMRFIIYPEENDTVCCVYQTGVLLYWVHGVYDGRESCPTAVIIVVRCVPMHNLACLGGCVRTRVVEGALFWSFNGIDRYSMSRQGGDFLEPNIKSRGARQGKERACLCALIL